MADFGSGAPPKMGPELQSAIRDDALYKARGAAAAVLLLLRCR